MLAAERGEDARRVADRLLEELDDADSRYALVEAALDAGVARKEHVRWFAEIAPMVAQEADEASSAGRSPPKPRTPDLDVMLRRLIDAGLVVDVTEGC